MNKVFLIGNLTRDPELRTLPSGVSVCRFGLAVSRNYASPDGERQTDFFNVTAWRTLGERVAQYLKKGSKAAVVGSVEIREYEDNQGNKRTAVDIIAQDVEFLTPKNSQGGDGTQPAAAPRTYSSQSSAASNKKPELQPFEDDSDIPF